MGLFSKKKEVKKEQVQTSSEVNIPEFPTVPEDEFPEFPSYEPTISDIKSGVEGTPSFEPQKFEIPAREKKPAEKRMPAADMEFAPREEPEPRGFPENGRPLFVQIDRYKEVMHSVDAVKSKLDDLDKLLSEFERLKEEEDGKIEDWKKDLQNIKNKLLSVDRELFEV